MIVVFAPTRFGLECRPSSGSYDPFRLLDLHSGNAWIESLPVAKYALFYKLLVPPGTLSGITLFLPWLLPS